MNSTDSCTLKWTVSNCQLPKDVYSCTPSTYVFSTMFGWSDFREDGRKIG